MVMFFWGNRHILVMLVGILKCLLKWVLEDLCVIGYMRFLVLKNLLILWKWNPLLIIWVILIIFQLMFLLNLFKTFSLFLCLFEIIFWKGCWLWSILIWIAHILDWSILMLIILILIPTLFVSLSSKLLMNKLLLEVWILWRPSY